MPGLRSLTREPLVHFAVIGALLFGFEAARRPARSGDADAVIVIGAADQARLAVRFRDQTGRAPSAEETRRLAETWADDEVLFREALALDLHRGDDEIRERLVRRMRMLQRGPADSLAPDDAELERYFAEHRDRYTLPVRRDVEQLFVAAGPGARAAAEALVRRAEAGDDPATLGGGHRAGRRLRRRSHDALSRELGVRVADAIAALAVNRWSIVAGDDGLHVVRVVEVHAAQTPPWHELRETVLRDLRAARAEDLVRTETAALRARYTVRIEAAR